MRPRGLARKRNSHPSRVAQDGSGIIRALPHDAETAIRQRMRVHPDPQRISNHPNVSPVLLDSEPEQAPKEARARKPIISINGKDVDEETLEKRDVA